MAVNCTQLYCDHSHEQLQHRIVLSLVNPVSTRSKSRQFGSLVTTIAVRSLRVKSLEWTIPVAMPSFPVDRSFLSLANSDIVTLSGDDYHSAWPQPRRTNCDRSFGDAGKLPNVFRDPFIQRPAAPRLFSQLTYERGKRLLRVNRDLLIAVRTALPGFPGLIVEDVNGRGRPSRLPGRRPRIGSGAGF